MTAVVVALLGALGVVGAAAIPVMLQQKNKVDETYRMLTVNHHSSAREGKDPTILDRLEDIKDLIGAVDGRMTEHIKHSESQDRRLERLEDHVYRD